MSTRFIRLTGISVFVFLFVVACQQPFGRNNNSDKENGSSDDSTAGDESAGDDPEKDDPPTPPAIVSIGCETNPEFVEEVEGTYKVRVASDTDDLANPLVCDFELEAEPENTVYYRLLDDKGSLPDWLDLVEDGGRVELTTDGEKPGTPEFGFYSSYNVDPDDDESGGATKDSPLRATFEITTDADE